MSILDAVLSAESPFGALLVIAVYAVIKIIDFATRRAINRAYFSEIWGWIKRKIKIILSKHRKIKCKYEFSVYIEDLDSKSSRKDVVDNVFSNVKERSKDSVEIDSNRWNSGNNTVHVKHTYMGKSAPYETTLRFVEPIEADKSLSKKDSIGVSIQFSFEFARLRNEIIDLSGFVQILQDAISEELGSSEFTEPQFIVSPIDADLTLDDWIKKEQMDISVLLESSDTDRSVRFYPDKATIKAPHSKIDDQTVEYVRATVLNYYFD
jgi:predicted HAD superfamily hydrolase